MEYIKSIKKLKGNGLRDYYLKLGIGSIDDDDDDAV